jgi:integrase
MAYGRLAKFASIDVNMAQYRGSYTPAAVNPRDLPSEETIVAMIEAMDNPQWRLAIALMATYGLRDHEIFYADLGALQSPPGVCTVLDGKTGWRQVWPYPPDWWERFCRGHQRLPLLTAKRNSDYGTKVAQFFKRRKLPMVPYDLRHAWAARTAVYGLDPAIAAKMMGHDLSVHTRVYHQFLSAASMQAAWLRSQGKSEL